MRELLDLLNVLKREQETFDELENLGTIDGQITIHFRTNKLAVNRNSIVVDLDKHMSLFKDMIKKELIKEMNFTKKRINELKKQYDKDIELMNKISLELENYKG